MTETTVVEPSARPAPASVQHEGFVVTSNEGTSDDLRRDLGVEATEHTASTEDVEATEGQPEKLKAGEVHKRIAKTTYEREEANRQREAAEKRAQELEEENKRLKAERSKPEQTETRRTEDEQKRYNDWKSGLDPDDPKPTAADKYDTYEAFLDARDEWNERRIERRNQRAAQERQQYERHEAISRAADTFKKRLDAEAAKDATFGEMARRIQIPGEGPLFDVFLHPDTPVELLVRHFDAHPDELTQLIGQRPGAQLAGIQRLIGRLEARAEAAQAGSVKREKPSTKAHDPINPVGGSHVAAKDDPPGDDATDAEWFAYYGRSGQPKR